MEQWLIGYKGLAQAAKVTPRMLQWWAEQKLVRPAIEGGKRIYTAEEAILTVAIAELRRSNVSLDQVRSGLEPLKRELKREQKRLGDCWLAFEPKGGIVVISPHSNTIIAAEVASRSAMWVIDLGKQVSRLPANTYIEAYTIT